MSCEPTATCMFFVDDSNMWIKAQKFSASGNSHMPKLTDRDYDPRLRIDVGRLINALRNGRNQGPSFIYGSRPPPNDSVWEAFKKSKFQPKIYDRANGKEKEVDNSMATDLSSKATELAIRAEYDPAVKIQKAHTTFVAISGDRDMLPPIKKVLESNIEVELWAWNSGISKEYLKLQAQNDLLTVQLLEKVFDKISFTNFRSTRKGKLDYGKTLVLCAFDDPDVKSDEDSVCALLVPLGRLFYVTYSKTKKEVFVEFPEVKNIEAMFPKVRELFEDIATVVSWPEYANRFNKNPPPTVEISNMYAPLLGDGQLLAPATSFEQGPEPTSTAKDATAEAQPTHGLTDPDDNEGWQTVVRSDAGKDHRRVAHHAQRCPHRIRCQKGGECGYYHSEEERSLFRDNPNVNFRRWKTVKCNVTYCRRGKRCRYAHARNEAWCLRCDHEGHYTKECRYVTAA